MSPATRNAHLYVGEFEAPAVFPAEEHLDTGALARRLELLSAPFGQSDLQDLDCLGLGCQVPRLAGLKGIKNARKQAGSLVALVSSKVKTAPTAALTI